MFVIDTRTQVLLVLSLCQVRKIR